MFILPIRTSIRPRRVPYANYALIVVNVIIFFLTWYPHKGAISPLRPWAEQFMLTPARPFLWQFVTYAFLHHDIMHIIGNMFFLYLFGNNVNDKLGHTGYICFYLAGSVFSGIGHTFMAGGNVLGASGAVAAVTGAYLVLFPQTLITVFYWLFIFIDTVDIPALYFIGIKLIFWDNIVERHIPNIAYGAHLSGYSFGILAILSMLALGLIKSSQFDLWSIIKRWNRRRRYQDVVSDGYDPFTGRKSRHITVKEVKKTAVERKKEEQINQLRRNIANRTAQRNLSAAADLYLQLITIDSGQILPRQNLLDIANQLNSEGKYVDAARAYEQFLNFYSGYEYAEQVQLMLGILYSRHLNNAGLAKKHLEAAAEKLTDMNLLEMCKNELGRIEH